MTSWGECASASFVRGSWRRPVCRAADPIARYWPRTAVLVAGFEADYFGTAEGPGFFLVITTTAAVLDDAAQRVAIHGLRPYDAVVARERSRGRA